MSNTVTLRTNSRLHILVPFNAIAAAKQFHDMKKDGAQFDNAPAVFLPINRG